MKNAGRSRKSHGRSPVEGEITTLRQQITGLDAEILGLLARRREMSREVARVKSPGRTGVRDVSREERLLVERIRAGRRHGLDARFVTQVFHEIIEDSIRLQQECLQSLSDGTDGHPEVIRIAFQGIEGAYSHLAAGAYFSEYADRLVFFGHKRFAEVFHAVESGRADYAMLPIENTTSGSINEVYDLLQHTRLAIVGEEKYRVEHCLVATREADPRKIGRICSHPQAVAQCSDFLSQLGDCRVEYYYDTAMAVERIKKEQDPTQAAIASEEAAGMFDLEVIRRNIANQEHNYTRFLVAARNPRKVDSRIPCKTSLVMATGQRAGSLVEALLVFRENGLNLTKLESRPIPGNPWEEMFYVDFEGNAADQTVQDALDELTRVTRFIKVLGTYPSRDLPRTTPSARAVLSARVPGGNGKGAAPAVVTSKNEKSKKKKSGYKLASREHKQEDTVIQVKGVRIGGPDLVLIAGPCSVESYEQIMTTAREVKDAGAQILRGGCFKPRTSPYSFQGLGFKGLDFMVEAGRAFGMPIVTEVLSPGDVAPVAEKADILQIGARNMQNFTLLSEAGRVNRPVMLKRGLMSSLDELLHAAEYILAQGNQQVFLCERGIRTFETATRNTLDLSAIPILRAETHLPVIVDPSHAAGERSVVPPLARAGKAVGAQGIMVEVHPEPEKALSDGPQALRFPQFRELAAELLA